MRLRDLGQQSRLVRRMWIGRVQAGRFEQRGLDSGDLGPHQLTEKRQALAAQEQRPRVRVVRVGGVRLPLLAVPNAPAGIHQRLAQNRPNQGDVALEDVGGIAVRISRESMENLGIMPRRASPCPPWRGSSGCERRGNDAGPAIEVD
jgi:hypothetical protein